MEFDPESGTLKCPSCGDSVEIENIEENIKEHAMTREALGTIRAEEKNIPHHGVPGMRSQGGGGRHSTAAECPYCGSNTFCPRNRRMP